MGQCTAKLCTFPTYTHTDVYICIHTYIYFTKARRCAAIWRHFCDFHAVRWLAWNGNLNAFCVFWKCFAVYFIWNICLAICFVSFTGEYTVCKLHLQSVAHKNHWLTPNGTWLNFALMCKWIALIIITFNWGILNIHLRARFMWLSPFCSLLSLCISCNYLIGLHSICAPLRNGASSIAHVKLAPERRLLQFPAAPKTVLNCTLIASRDF